MKVGDYVLKKLMAIVLFAFGLYIAYINLQVGEVNAYAVIVGLEITTGGILLVLNKFDKSSILGGAK